MVEMSRRLTSPVFVGRARRAGPARRRARARRGRPPGVRVHRRRVGRRQDAAAARVRGARTRARCARAARTVPGAGRRADPVRAAGRRVATARARARRRRGRDAPRRDPQRARGAAAGAGRHRDARRRGAAAPARAACSRGCSRCWSGSDARRRCCWRSRTSTGRTAPPATSSTSWSAARARSALCLVVTYRSDELHRRHPLRPLLAELERAAGVERIALERFDRAEVVEQLAGILASSPSDELAERLYCRSHGNPLYTEELLAASEDGDTWLLPETLRDVLIARVERLSPAAQAVVRIAAVVDRPVTHGLLEAVADLPPGELMDGAREAVAHQVLVIDEAGTYAFRHALVGEAVHGDLIPGEDTALHARIAAAIDERPELLGDVTEATVAAELACHWKNAHELSRSLGASVRAGMAAKRVYAYEVAQRQFERALQLWDRVPDAAERAGMDHAAVLRHAATCASARGEASRSIALIREALGKVDPDAEPERAVELYQRLGHYLRQAGSGRESFAAFDRAVALLPPGPSAARARVLEERARVEMLLGDFDQARETVDAGDRRRAHRRRGADRGARAHHARLHAGRARRRDRGDRDAARGARARRRGGLAGRSQPRDDQPLRGAGPRRPHRGGARRRGGGARRGARAARARPASTRSWPCRRVGAAHPARPRSTRRASGCPSRVPGEAAAYTGIFWRDTRARLALLAGDLRRAAGGAGRAARAWPGRRPSRSGSSRARTWRSSSRSARTGSRTPASCSAAPPRGSSTPTRRRAAAHDLDGAARRGRGGRPRAGARRALRAGARGRRRAPARARRGAPAVRRGLRLERDGRRRSCQRRRTLLGDAPADPRPVGGGRARVRRDRAPDPGRLRALPRRRGARDGRRPGGGRGAAARGGGVGGARWASRC